MEFSGEILPGRKDQYLLNDLDTSHEVENGSGMKEAEDNSLGMKLIFRDNNKHWRSGQSKSWYNIIYYYCFYIILYDIYYVLYIIHYTYIMYILYIIWHIICIYCILCVILTYSQFAVNLFSVIFRCRSISTVNVFLHYYSLSLLGSKCVLRQHAKTTITESHHLNAQ